MFAPSHGLAGGPAELGRHAATTPQTNHQGKPNGSAAQVVQRHEPTSCTFAAFSRWLDELLPGLSESPVAPDAYRALPVAYRRAAELVDLAEPDPSEEFPAGEWTRTSTESWVRPAVVRVGVTTLERARSAIRVCAKPRCSRGLDHLIAKAREAGRRDGRWVA